MKREDASIITVEEINMLLDNYRIGRKPLAKLLGWGETTIIRYLDGDIPTVEYSDKLIQLLNHPAEYLRILTHGKENITSVAYKKSYHAVVMQLIHSKICIVAQHMINRRHKNICLAELEILLYYAQGFYLSFYDKALFEDEYLINEKHIPYKEILEQYRDNEFCYIELDKNMLEKEEKDIINEVLDAFEWYGLMTLNKFLEGEQAKAKISRNREGLRVLNEETIKEHFDELREQYFVHTPDEIGRYTDRRFFEIRNLHK